ncbi:hypothetical protein P4O66_008233, partial [Electrophorus voltai]
MAPPTTPIHPIQLLLHRQPAEVGSVLVPISSVGALRTDVPSPSQTRQTPGSFRRFLFHAGGRNAGAMSSVVKGYHRQHQTGMPSLVREREFDSELDGRLRKLTRCNGEVHNALKRHCAGSRMSSGEQTGEQLRKVEKKNMRRVEEEGRAEISLPCSMEVKKMLLTLSDGEYQEGGGTRRYLREGPQSLRRPASTGIHRHLQSLPDTRIVPSSFKRTTIIPVPKKPRPSGLNDYCPVAITSFAYRHNCSTDDAIAHLLHTTLAHLDKGRGNYVKMLFVDYSSAFNTIIPSLLTTKLEDLGLHTSLCDWISNFLTDRPQSVRVGNCASSTLSLSTGAPQGCVLSPLLYLLYTYDCTATSSSTIIVKFADDTVVMGLISDNNERAYLEEIKHLENWCQENNLLNVSKTKELIMDCSKKQEWHYQPVRISGTMVERVDSFRRLRDFRLPSKVLRNFYTCTIESILMGNITVWFGNSTKQDRQALQRVVRSAERITRTELPDLQTIYYK